MDVLELGPADKIRHRGVARVLAPIGLGRCRVIEVEAEEIEALLGDRAGEVGKGEFALMDVEEHVPTAVEVVEILPPGADGDQDQIVAGHGVPAEGADVGRDRLQPTLADALARRGDGDPRAGAVKGDVDDATGAQETGEDAPAPRRIRQMVENAGTDDDVERPIETAQGKNIRLQVLDPVDADPLPHPLRVGEAAAAQVDGEDAVVGTRRRIVDELQPGAASGDHDIQGLDRQGAKVGARKQPVEAARQVERRRAFGGQPSWIGTVLVLSANRHRHRIFDGPEPGNGIGDHRFFADVDQRPLDDRRHRG